MPGTELYIVVVCLDLPIAPSLLDSFQLTLSLQNTQALRLESVSSQEPREEDLGIYHPT